MRNLTVVAMLAACLAVVGCASDKKRKTSRSGSSGTTSGAYGPSTSGTDDSGIIGGAGASGAAAGMPAERVVYFDLDSSELKGEAQATVGAWAQYLSANPSARVRLEGHCDERGTREYNIGLGERRANAVLQALRSQGVAAKQLSAASFGEERPVALGHDESAWAQNRRVEIVP